VKILGCRKEYWKEWKNFKNRSSDVKKVAGDFVRAERKARKELVA
jgi:hypothetical protein